VFGEVIEGMDVIAAFEERSGTADADAPSAPLLLERASVSVAVRQETDK
jgi:hypothetical protein